MLKVTDKLVLKRLAEQDIDSDYVEFCQDYAKRGVGKSPYMKGYRDLLSNKWFAVFSGLPMVDAYGFKHELVWHEKNKIIENGNNIFHCTVKDGTVRLIVLSDQPYGVKKNTECSYHAQLFINGSEVLPDNPIPLILATDPVNENYHDNVILWQYDNVCQRKIRIIEGRFRERWLFNSNPHSKVRIKHNFAGSLKLRLGYARDAEGNSLKVTVIGDEEIIEASEFDNAVFPVEISGSATYYPDAHVEETSVDGDVGETTDTDWATMVVAAGDDGRPSQNPMTFCSCASAAGGNIWNYIYRGIALFNTSGLRDNSFVSIATLSVYGTSKLDDLGITPDANIYSSNPVSNINLVASDYATLGTTAYATAVAYADLITGGYQDFSLNAIGKSAISKISVSKFGFRNANYDVTGNPPSWSSGLTAHYYINSAEQGSGFKPKLVITYILYPQIVSII